MCGLVGCAGDTTGKAKDIFTELLIVDSVRGMHSTGAGLVKRWKNEIVTIKQPGPSHFLIMQDEYKKLMNEAGIKCIVGHNRYATIGAHTTENAHPFAFPTLVGAHNGTLDSVSRKKLFQFDKFGTDSEAIFANINQFGLKATVELLQGAWALTWFDSTDNTLNFLRNSKRPLFYCYSKDRCTMYWASESEMLELVLKRHASMPEKDEIFVVDPDVHHKWAIPESINGKFEFPVKEEMKAPPPPPVTITTYHYGAYGGGWQEKDHKSSNRQQQYHSTSSNVVPFANGGKTSTGMLFNHKVDTAKFRPPYKDSTGKILNKKAFNKLVSAGCVFCNENHQEWGEFIKPLKDADGRQVYLCEACYNDDEIFEICSNLI